MFFVIDLRSVICLCDDETKFKPINAQRTIHLKLECCLKDRLNWGKSLFPEYLLANDMDIGNIFSWISFFIQNYFSVF